MTIQPYIHRCVIQSGDAAGSTLEHEVDPFDIAFSNDCENCGSPLAPLTNVVAHIYEQLTSA